MMGEQIGLLGRMWFFRMIGSAKGQSFHEQMAASGAFANPLTAVVEGTDLAPEETSYSFGMYSSTFSTADAQRFGLLAAKLARDAKRYPDARWRVELVGSGGKKQDRAWADARTAMAKEKLVAAKVPEERIVTAADDTAERRLVVRVGFV